MTRARPETTTPTPQWPGVPDYERTVESLCQEWHFVETKLQTDVAAVPEFSPTHDDEVARLCDVANDRIHEVERALAASKPRFLGDVRAILSVVAKIMATESLGEPRDRGMVAVALNWFDSVRNVTAADDGPAPFARVPDDVVASAARDLEADVCDLYRMADVVQALGDDALGDVTTDEGSRLRLVIEQMHKMAVDLRSKYYAAISPGRHPVDEAA